MAERAAEDPFRRLPDAVLARVLRALAPYDAFAAAGVSRRFAAAAAAAAAANTLVVDRRAAAPAAAHDARRRFATLAAAVAASQPGDAIVLAAGQIHEVAAPGVLITHALDIRGGGAVGSLHGAVLVGARGADVLRFAAPAARLSNVTVLATLGAAVAHARGRLGVERCVLRAAGLGLDHLAAPLAAEAVGARGAVAVGGAGAEAAALDASGPGALVVAETELGGGARAVALRGSGALRRVRAACGPAAQLFWLEVDSAEPPPPLALRAPPPPPLALRAPPPPPLLALPAAAPLPALDDQPSWAARAPWFDACAFAAAAGAPPRCEADLEARERLWRAGRARAAGGAEAGAKRPRAA
jgi:hypothetical protein